MNQDLLFYLICPNCGADNLSLEAYETDQQRVSEGIITCNACKNWYRIEQTVLDFLPLNLRQHNLYVDFAARHQLSYQIPGGINPANNEKVNQIEWFKTEFDDYEMRVVNSPFYQALDTATVIAWLNHIHESVRGIVLDIGGGTGRLAIPLAELGLRSISMDISESMLRLARQKIDAQIDPQLVDLVACDGENPPVKDNTFDACIIYGVLHHMPQPGQTIANAARKLRKGGLFYSLDPHNSPVRFLFDLLMRLNTVYNEEASDHPHFTIEMFSRWLDEAGLDGKLQLTTYLPPHVFHPFKSLDTRIAILKTTDSILGSIPGIRKFAGIIISKGTKQ